MGVEAHMGSNPITLEAEEKKCHEFKVSVGILGTPCWKMKVK